MIPYMVGKLAPNASHLTRGLVKYVPGRDYSCAVPSQKGDKYVTSPPPPPIVELVLIITLEPPQDVDQDTACGSGRDHRGHQRSGIGIGSLGRLMLWEI